MNSNILFSMLLALPAIHAAEPEAPKENKPDLKRENFDGINIQERDEKIFWAKRKKAVEKQRAEEAAKASKPEESTAPKETMPETAPAE